MRLRQYIPEQDSQEICEWVNTDERVFALWCANRFEYPLTPERFHSELQKLRMDWNDETFVVENDMHEIVGFIDYAFNSREEGFIKFVLVSPQHRGKGIGSEMLKLIIDYARNISKVKACVLNVFSINKQAIECYRKLGFIEVSETPNVFPYKDELWGRISMRYELSL